MNKKEEEHKILLARAHLIMEDYKRAIIKINELLSKKEKEAMQSKQKVIKSEETLKDMDKNLVNQDK